MSIIEALGPTVYMFVKIPNKILGSWGSKPFIACTKQGLVIREHGHAVPTPFLQQPRLEKTSSGKTSRMICNKMRKLGWLGKLLRSKNPQNYQQHHIERCHRHAIRKQTQVWGAAWTMDGMPAGSTPRLPPKRRCRSSRTTKFQNTHIGGWLWPCSGWVPLGSPDYHTVSDC